MLLGLPLHPLAVHFGVVLGLLGAVGVLLAAVWPRFRRWLGWGLPVLAVAAAGALRVTQSLGEVLQASGPEYGTPAVARHAELGALAGTSGLALGAVGVLLWLTTSEGPRARWTGRWPSWVATVVRVLAVGAALTAAVTLTLAGHSGASAVWGG